VCGDIVLEAVSPAQWTGWFLSRKWRRFHARQRDGRRTGVGRGAAIRQDQLRGELAGEEATIDEQTRLYNTENAETALAKRYEVGVMKNEGQSCALVACRVSDEVNAVQACKAITRIQGHN
jgi:hypothetical protein